MLHLFSLPFLHFAKLEETLPTYLLHSLYPLNPSLLKRVYLLAAFQWVAAGYLIFPKHAPVTVTSVADYHFLILCVVQSLQGQAKSCPEIVYCTPTDTYRISSIKKKDKEKY